jgi:hypothetical protein
MPCGGLLGRGDDFVGISTAGWLEQPAPGKRQTNPTSMTSISFCIRTLLAQQCLFVSLIKRFDFTAAHGRHGTVD